MQVIIEGPDFAGKSTLAQYLSNELMLPLRHSGGPSKAPGEINERAATFNLQQHNSIYDRHPCVSQNIYGDAFQDPDRERVTDDNIRAFYASNPLIIYCRLMDIGKAEREHQQSENSDAEHARKVNDHLDAICNAYDAWALDHAHIVYRIGDNTRQVANFVAGALLQEQVQAFFASTHIPDFLGDIEAFHQKFDLAYDGLPRQLPPDVSNFRVKFMNEELGEYEEAYHQADFELVAADDEASFIRQLEKQLDSLVDEVYVVLGTAYLQGFLRRLPNGRCLFDEAWQRVQAANMAKVRAAADGSDSRRKSSHDVVKPAGWEPPKHTDLLEQHAHRDVFKSIER